MYQTSPGILASNAKYHRTAKGLFARLKQKAKKRHLQLLISFEEFLEIRTGSCFYCGGELPEVGYGLDRKDSGQPYYLENLVPCCSSCNRIKGADLTHEEMIVAMEAVLKYRRLGA